MPSLFATTVTLSLSLIYSAALLAAPVVKVTIEGVSGEHLANVRQWLSIEQQREHPLLTAGRIQQLHNKADQEIKSALQPYGYYRPQIEKSLIQVADEQWQATYQIEPGVPLQITTLEWEIEGDAASDPEFEKLRRAFPLHEGDILDQTRYEQAKRELMKLASERGYFDADFSTARIAIDPERYTSSITLLFNSGRRYRFAETVFNQDALDDDFLHRFVPYREDDPYHIDQLLDLQHGLMGTDYFSVVELQPQSPNRADGTVPVGITLEPRKRQRYLMALGYGTDTGPRLKFGLELPLVNRRGHRFDTEYQISAIEESFKVRYRIPIRNPREEQLIFSGNLSNEEFDAGDSIITSAGASLLQVQGAWKQTLSLSYHDERYFIAAEENQSTLVMPAISLSRHIGNDNDFLLVDQGMLISAEARGGADWALSDTSFIQGQLHLKGITSLGKRQRLITRGTVGGTNALDFDQIPTSLRFFAGGSQSVRGYDYEALGPTDELGNVIGGKYLLTGSIEYELRLTQDWSWAVFADAGNAVNDFKTAMKQGSGTGVRWQTPVGPIRLDIAWAITEPDNPWRIHFNIGPDL